MQIGEYKTLSKFVTIGSGNARWCIALKDGKQYFLKQFLAPVQPVQTTEEPTEQVLLRRARCAAFERDKLLMYQALQTLHGDCVVKLEDFFVHDGHYFAVSEYLDPSLKTFETIHSLPQRMRSLLLYSLAECLRMLHDCGVVHADLKPEHIIIKTEFGQPRIRLIDFDSGFLAQSPPEVGAGVEADPVYMAPETFRLMTNQAVKLDHKVDTFAFGILLHRALTGELLSFDREKYTYLYACVLDGGKVTLSDALGDAHRALIQKMLQKKPAKRPDDDKVSAVLRTML